MATVGSPAANAAVKSSVASADPPHPITSKASQPEVRKRFNAPHPSTTAGTE